MDAATHPPLAALLLLLALAPAPAAMAVERLLHGLVQTTGTQGELSPAANVQVTLLQTGRGMATDSAGIFLLELTDRQAAGQEVRLSVGKDGWVIDHPLEGRVIVPANLDAQVVELRLLPKGSKRLWTDERIESLIAEFAAKTAAAIRDRPAEPGGTAPTQGPPPDFAALIADWAGRYGFGPAEVQAQIDRWATATEARADDPYRLGLAAYARKNFTDAFRRGMESGDAYAGRLAANRERERDLLEKTLRGYRLAGDAAAADYRFDEALAAYEKGLAVVRREESPRDWAEMTVLVGAAHLELGTRLAGAESRRHLAAAVAAYREALTVFARAELPQGWAMTQNNLGDALSEQGTRTGGDEGRQLLAAAVTAYREALTVFTRAELPQAWAATQNNLGNALSAQGNRTDGEEGRQRLAAAVTAYREALTVHTRAESPQDWARIQNNLGSALSRQGSSVGFDEGRQLLEAAVTAYREALTVYTRAELPQQWAGTQYNLGIALRKQGTRTDGAEGRQLLAAAVAAFREALTVYTRAELPQDWAATQNNLGAALQEQGTRIGGDEGRQLLAAAVAAYREDLSVYTRGEMPQQWAMTQYNLAIALSEQGARTGGDEGLRLLAAGVTACHEALTVRTRTELPQDWAWTQNNLGVALREQGTRTGSEEGRRLLVEAVAAFRAALTVWSREYMAPQWRQTQTNLGRTYAALGDAQALGSVVADLLRADPDGAETFNTAQTLYHETLFDYPAAHRLTGDWLQHHPEDLPIQRNYAETHLTTGRLAEARERLAALIAPADQSQRPDPSTESALRLLEITALAGIADSGSSTALPGRLADLRALVAAQPPDFKVGWTFAGTGHYIETAPAFAPSRAPLLDLIRAAGEGRDALMKAIDAAGTNLAKPPRPAGTGPTKGHGGKTRHPGH